MKFLRLKSIYLTRFIFISAISFFPAMNLKLILEKIFGILKCIVFGRFISAISFFSAN